MKKILLALVLLLPSNLFAQGIFVKGSGVSAGGNVNNPFLFPASSCAAPSLASQSDITDGIYIASNAQLFCINGAETGRITSTGFAVGANNDTLWARRAANTPVINIGAATFSAATNSATMGGVLCVNTTAQATTGTVEEILATCTLPANAMSANGKGFKITAWGTFAANANSKTVRVRFGGISGASFVGVTLTSNNVPWLATGHVIRTGAATQIAYGQVAASTTSPVMTTTSPAQTLSNALDIVFTGTTPTAAGDITFLGAIVEFIN